MKLTTVGNMKDAHGTNRKLTIIILEGTFPVPKREFSNQGRGDGLETKNPRS